MAPPLEKKKKVRKTPLKPRNIKPKPKKSNNPELEFFKAVEKIANKKSSAPKKVTRKPSKETQKLVVNGNNFDIVEISGEEFAEMVKDWKMRKQQQKEMPVKSQEVQVKLPDGDVLPTDRVKRSNEDVFQISHSSGITKTVEGPFTEKVREYFIYA